MTNAVTEVIDAPRSIDPNDIDESIKVMGAAADALERLSKPSHEREPPHCSNCSCGLNFVAIEGLNMEVIIHHARDSITEAQEDDGWVMIKAEMLSLLLEEIERQRHALAARMAMLDHPVEETMNDPYRPTNTADVARSSESTAVEPAGEHPDTKRLKWLLDDYRSMDLYNAIDVLHPTLEEARVAIDKKISVQNRSEKPE